MAHGFNQDLRQRQTQSLVLAPQLRQSLKILQVAALDLRATVQQELEANPALEDASQEADSLDADPTPAQETAEDERAASDEGSVAPGTADPATADQDSPESAETLDFSQEFAVLEKLGQDYRDNLYDQAGGQQPHTAEDTERRQHFFDSIVAETSLQEHLLRQAELLELSPAAATALRHLIGGLDERGFLTQTPSEAALQAGLPLEAAQEAAQLLRTFEPTGIGAKDLPDCLILQIRAAGRADSLAFRILRDHFQLLTRRRIPEIARKTGADLEDVQAAIEEIGRLDPAPGRRFAEDSNRSIAPDVTVEKDGDEWKIHLNNDHIPRLRISAAYRDMIARGTLTKPERDYLREKIRSGQFIISSIEQRQQTIERITRELLRLQRDFFEEGVAKLHPLTMTQVADIVGVHETTVSRAVANKYIRTPHGVFDLKFFFTPGYEADDGATVSNKSVKELIAEFVYLEEKTKPLSDEQIVKQLQAKGLKVARRTVAKYREELGILPSNLRRDYTG
jgi:RNA polymerase sigma-54 factor